MTLLDRIIARGMIVPVDPIMAARIERHVHRIQPDPLFRRRLRTVVVNRYVAAREGLAAPPLARRLARREMGALGRGVLYASLLSAVSMSAVAAASQESLPGDALYDVKIQLEQVRIRIAPPGLRDDLASMALDERLDEMEELASMGRWQLVDDAAANVIAAEAQVDRLSEAQPGGSSAASSAVLQGHADRLAELMTTAPTSALHGLERALQASMGSTGTPGQPQSGDQSSTSQPHGLGSGSPSTGSTGVSPDGSGSQEPQGTDGTGQATDEPRETPSPPSPPPSRSPSPTAAPSASSEEEDQGGDAQEPSSNLPTGEADTASQGQQSPSHTGKQ